MWQEHYDMDNLARDMIEEGYSLEEIIAYFYDDGWDSEAIKQTLLDTKKFIEEEIDTSL